MVKWANALPTMQANNLATYLNDHLAGSVLALEMLDHLAECSTDDPLKQRKIRSLHQEIAGEQQLLKILLNQISTPQSVIKMAGAWVAEKLAHLKLRIASSADAALGRMEAFEMLSLGIEGKKGLWRSLQAVEDQLPEGPVLDLEALIDAAEQQRHLVETWRLEASVQAFSSAPTAISTL